MKRRAATIIHPPMYQDSKLNKWFLDIYHMLRSSGVGIFSAKKTADQAIPSLTWTTVEFESEVWRGGDTWYDTSTDKYNPHQAGYYQINAVVSITPAAGASSGSVRTRLCKNGAVDKEFPTAYTSCMNAVRAGGSAIVKANGRGDYFTLQIYHDLGVTCTMDASNASSEQYMQGVLLTHKGYGI